MPSEDRDGFFHVANGGTLFLDEVADLPLAMQVKLLARDSGKTRAQGRRDRRGSGRRAHHLRHPSEPRDSWSKSGKFRQDLYYRLAVIELRMPSPARMPRGHSGACRRRFSHRLAQENSAPRGAPVGGAPRRYPAYDFPGNTRELENILERAIALSQSAGDRGGGPATRAADAAEPTSRRSPNAKWPLQDYLDRIEREAILEALEKTRFNRTAAAKVLGITFRALRYRMERLGIT